jgi:hypothetical protein
MRTFAMACSLSLSILGCTSVPTHRDSFLSLHDLIKNKLSESGNCGPINTNRVVAGRYFEVSPQPRGLPITVSERQFFTQKDWESHYTSGTNIFSRFMDMLMTNQPAGTNRFIDPKTADRYAGVMDVFDLPNWSYERIGVDVDVQAIEVVYPGLEEDRAAAQKQYREIVKLLKPYHRTKHDHAGPGR